MQSQRHRGHRPPQVTLPPALGKAVEAVADADRRWFREHPGRRWYVRPTAVADIEAFGVAGLFDPRAGHLCLTCEPYTLVWTLPSRKGRFWTTVDRPFARPDDVLPGLSLVLQADDDTSFKLAMSVLIASRRRAPQ